ncbi:uncharacterized protein LOC142163231 [Nicotiana tabacum]|uniref:Uncharacterized protein LOC142163231 n=1 Tax=Nicotiana tabacum TaxID=4097 RepID=A0AC58RV37_TOBAC
MTGLKQKFSVTNRHEPCSAKTLKRHEPLWMVIQDEANQNLEANLRVAISEEAKEDDLIESCPEEAAITGDFAPNKNEKKEGDSRNNTQLDVLKPIESKLPNPPPKNLDYSLRCAYYSDTPGHDTKKCWHLKNAIQELIDTNQIVVQSPEAPNINQNPLPAYAEMHMIEIVHKDGMPKKPSQFIMMIWSSESELVKDLVVTKATSVIAKGSTDKLSMPNDKTVVVVEKRSPSDVIAKQEKPKVIVPGVASKTVIIVEGAHTDPIVIKHVTQLPVANTKTIPWNYERVIVTYKGKEVKEEVNEAQGLTRSRRCFASTELCKAKTLRDNPVLVKKSVTKEEAEEFLRKMKAHDYSIVEQLRKTPAQISLLSLLIHSDEHRQALMKILNEAHVPEKITVNHLEKIVNKIFESNRITFSDDDLPPKGTEHNRALYLIVKYKDSVVTSVPWIHVAKVVPSSLHQMVKFEWDRQEIIVHGNENLCAFNDTYISFIEAKEDKGSWVYQVSEAVSVEKVPEGE